MRRSRYGLLLLTILLGQRWVQAADLTVQLGKEFKAKSAVAITDGSDGINGSIKDQTITFHDLQPDTPYGVKVGLEDGTVLQGVDLHWYNEDPPKPKVNAFSDDDRKEIQDIMNVPSFYNENDILLVNGDHDRATILAQLIRSKSFHSDKGDEVIWRIELWYFKNEYGGWAKISQVHKILRRERFSSRAEYEKETSKLKWTPELGGIVLTKDKPTQIIVPAAKAPATRPAEQEPEN